jgi:ferredoxin
MRVFVDLSVCQGHGQCVLASAQVFELDDELNLHYKAEPPDALLGEVEEAALMCPTQAITVDPEGGSAPRK